MPRKIARYGWRPDLPDHRDKLYRAAPPVKLPFSTDLRSGCPPVYDQGQLGSCTANAIAAALEFERKLHGLTDFTPSRLFIYYNERLMEGDVGQDNGAQIRDGISSVAKQGAPPESDWPYIETQFAAAPPAGDYTEALADRALQYQRLDNTNIIQLKTCLAGASPFIFGFTVYPEFESDAVAATGIVPVPNPSEEPVGGHAVLCVGYNDADAMFLVRNSWGPSWGQEGYFKIPYSYLTDENLADDFWTITLVGQ